ncbi:hypothetical protein LLH00_01040, partial [bacterium]|nr:hypothetical protein [bacterium]
PKVHFLSLGRGELSVQFEWILGRRIAFSMQRGKACLFVPSGCRFVPFCDPKAGFYKSQPIYLQVINI